MNKGNKVDTTCAFYRCDRNADCSALRSRDCVGCTFRKTDAELIAGRRKAIGRLEELPHNKFNDIMLKYYRFNKFSDDATEEGEDEE